MEYKALAGMLPEGRENAITAGALAALFNTDARQITRAIEHLRKREHIPVCASCSGKGYGMGYYLPADERELEEYIHSMARRVTNVTRTYKALARFDWKSWEKARG